MNRIFFNQTYLKRALITSCLLIFYITSLCAFENEKKLKILFVTANDDESTQKLQLFAEQLSSFYPITLYQSQICFYHLTLNREPVKLSDYNTFQLDHDVIQWIDEKYSSYCDLLAVIVPGKENAGIGGKTGKSGLPIIAITTSSLPELICHEFLHAFIELGDEYGEGLLFTPTEKEVSRYANLTYKPYDPLWLEIKEKLDDKKIGYYPGGLGTGKGVYHSYPLCIMIDEGSPICPICAYLTIQKLNRVLDQSVNFYQTYPFTQLQSKKNKKIDILRIK